MGRAFNAELLHRQAIGSLRDVEVKQFQHRQWNRMDGESRVCRCDIGNAHGCMPGGIVAAMSEKFTALYRKPWINLTYDGFVESTTAQKSVILRGPQILQPGRRGRL